MATSNFIRISILTKLKLSFVLTLNRFFILLQRGLYSNRNFYSYLDPDKAEAFVCFDSKPILFSVATKSIQQQEILFVSRS